VVISTRVERYCQLNIDKPRNVGADRARFSPEPLVSLNRVSAIKYHLPQVSVPYAGYKTDCRPSAEVDGGSYIRIRGKLFLIITIGVMTKRPYYRRTRAVDDAMIGGPRHTLIRPLITAA